MSLKPEKRNVFLDAKRPSSRRKKKGKKDIQISQNYFINQININNLRNKLSKNLSPDEINQKMADKLFKKRSASSKKERRKSKCLLMGKDKTQKNGNKSLKSNSISQSFLSMNYKKKFLNFLESRRKRDNNELSIQLAKNNFLSSPEMNSSKIKSLMSNSRSMRVKDFFMQKKLSEFKRKNLKNRNLKKMKSFKKGENGMKRKKISSRKPADLMSLTLNQRLMKKPSNPRRSLGSFTSNYRNLKKARKSLRNNFLKKLKKMKEHDANLLSRPVKQKLIGKGKSRNEVAKKLNFSGKKKRRKSRRKFKGHKKSTSFDVNLFVSVFYLLKIL